LYDYEKLTRLLKSCLLYLLACLPLTAFVQEPVAGAEYTLYNETHQLYASSINDIRKDHHGFYWLATERGLIRFDGRNFIEINPPDQTYHRREIEKLNVRGDTLLIFYQGQGCHALHIGSLAFKTVTSQQIDDGILLAGNGILLLQRDGTIVKIRNGKTIAAQSYTSPKKGLMLYHRDRLYISLPGTGAFELDTSSLKVSRRLPCEPEAYKESFSIVGDDVFLVTNGRAIMMDQTLTRIKNNDYGKPLGRSISALTSSSPNHQFFICNNNLLFGLINSQFRSIPLPGLENFELRNILVSDSSNILLGTNQGLVHVRLGQRRSGHIQERREETNGELRIRRKILEKKDGTLLLMGSPFTFIRRPGEGLKKLMNSRFSAYDAVFAESDLYVATEGVGLIRIRPGADSPEMIRVTPDLNKGFYLSVWYDSIQRFILVGGPETLTKFDPETGKAIKLPVLKDCGMVRVIKQDHPDRNYWIGTDNGVYVLDSNLRATVQFTRNDGGLRGSRVGDIIQRQNSSELWIAHDRGVDIVDRKRMRISGQIPDSVFINPRVVSLLEDQYGRLWMGTYSGIVGYDPASRQIHRLGRNNGLINTEYNYKAALRMRDGRLIFGGLNGYDIIDPISIPFTGNPQKGIITGIHRFKGEDTIFQSISGKPGRISFDTQNEYLRIYVSGKDVFEASEQTYEYNIDGRQWIALNGAAYINILRLDPGQYTLNIRAFDAYGSEVRFDPLFISATVPFLKSRLFLLILIGFVLLFMTLFIVSSVKAKKREMQLKERIAMDLHDEVGTMLTRALYVARTDERSATNLHLVQSLNESLFSLRAHINTMNTVSFEFSALSDDVREMTQSLLDRTNCRGQVEAKTDSEYRIKGELCRDIRLCLYEIINNTLKHSDADTLRIYLTAHRSVLTIFTRDNGKLGSTEELGTTGNGMKNLRKRVDRHRGHIDFGTPRSGRGLTVRMRFDI
jgi:hypothetical protein